MGLIYTAIGNVEESTLAKTENIIDNDREYTIETEWRTDEGTLVKRSVHVTLKEPAVFAKGEAQILF